MSSGEIRLDRSRVEAREIDGEIVIYDLASRRYLGGNRTATDLWPMLREGTTVTKLAGRLEERFGIDAESARADVEAFVDSLAANGLLDEDEPS
jgi:hypothetical protein